MGKGGFRAKYTPNFGEKFVRDTIDNSKPKCGFCPADKESRAKMCFFAPHKKQPGKKPT
jgi:hypothetical protein